MSLDSGIMLRKHSKDYVLLYPPPSQKYLPGRIHRILGDGNLLRFDALEKYVLGEESDSGLYGLLLTDLKYICSVFGSRPDRYSSDRKIIRTLEGYAQRKKMTMTSLHRELFSYPDFFQLSRSIEDAPYFRISSLLEFLHYFKELEVQFQLSNA